MGTANSEPSRIRDLASAYMFKGHGYQEPVSCLFLSVTGQISVIIFLRTVGCLCCTQGVSTVVGAHRRDWAGLGGLSTGGLAASHVASPMRTQVCLVLWQVSGAEGLSSHLGDSLILTCDDTREYHLLMSRTSLFQVLPQHSSVSRAVSLPVIIKSKPKPGVWEDQTELCSLSCKLPLTQRLFRWGVWGPSLPSHSEPKSLCPLLPQVRVSPGWRHDCHLSGTCNLCVAPDI